MAEAHASPSPAAPPPPRPRDPLAWCFALTGLYALIAGWRLAIPSEPFFDEVHYIPAARALLDAKPHAYWRLNEFTGPLAADDAGQGRDAAKQALKEKPELAEKIGKAILEKVTIKPGEPVLGEG